VCKRHPGRLLLELPHQEELRKIDVGERKDEINVVNRVNETFSPATTIFMKRRIWNDFIAAI
jgi:hypothetical protein